LFHNYLGLDDLDELLLLDPLLEELERLGLEYPDDLFELLLDGEE
jgi:hypothetical protein